MKRITSLTLVLGMLVLASCDKNQKAVNQLEGEWKVTSQTITAFGFTTTEAPEDNIIYTFNKCDNDDGNCTGTLQFNSDPAQKFSYSAEDEGESLVLIDEETNSSINLQLEKIDRNTRDITIDFADFSSIFGGEVDSTFTGGLDFTIKQTIERQ